MRGGTLARRTGTACIPPIQLPQLHKPEIDIPRLVRQEALPNPSNRVRDTLNGRVFKGGQLNHGCCSASQRLVVGGARQTSISFPAMRQHKRRSRREERDGTAKERPRPLKCFFDVQNQCKHSSQVSVRLLWAMATSASAHNERQVQGFSPASSSTLGLTADVTFSGHIHAPTPALLLFLLLIADGLVCTSWRGLRYILLTLALFSHQPSTPNLQRATALWMGASMH